MAKARKEVELAVRVGGKASALGEVLAAVASRNVNVLAYCTYSDREELVVLLVTDDAFTAKDALQAAGYSCKANSVVLVGASDEVGAAAWLGAHLGFAGIEILYSYASSSGADQFCAVFKTTDDERAIMTLEACPQARAAA
ncbi:MAG TPA: hypothetical protein VL171_03945 [Verrucomicrobiae bacterium]|nr:hypothetical protein [Verrucomicrobiae bacterium]